MSDTIAEGKVVIIHFTLHDAEGEVLESSVGDEPMPYLHGASNIVPGLEKALDGKKVGDNVDVTVAPADAYGDYEDGGTFDIPLEHFPDEMEPELEMQLFAQNEAGESFPIWVVEIGKDTVTADRNHPLAGQSLRFVVEVVGVRDATDDERDHGHPHGIDGQAGHHH